MSNCSYIYMTTVHFVLSSVPDFAATSLKPDRARCWRLFCTQRQKWSTSQFSFDWVFLPEKPLARKASWQKLLIQPTATLGFRVILSPQTMLQRHRRRNGSCWEKNIAVICIWQTFPNTVFKWVNTERIFIFSSKQIKNAFELISAKLAATFL